MPLTNDQAYELLNSARERGRLGHAFLITGENGVGKRALATKIISMLNAPKEEVAEVDMFGDPVQIAPSADDSANIPLEDSQSEFVRVVRPRSKSRLIRVEEMRELEDSFYMSAPDGQWKIGVIIDADRMNESAANAFLKTLEEPPNNCLLLLLTTAPDRLLTTILSRCVNIPLYNPDFAGLSDLQNGINEIISKALKGQSRGIASALSLKASFDFYLKAEKDTIVQKHKAALKEETDQLKQVVDKDFLKSKEDQAKAAEASDYLALRTDSINTLISWFGDVIRWKVGHTPSRFSESVELFSDFAADLSIDSLLLRMEALEELRYLLTETNVSEALALETSFMNAFG